jgi:hypothetical protein
LEAGSRAEEIDALEAEVNRGLAQQRYLEDQLKLLTVTSPVTGVIVTHRPKEEIGQHVQKGDLIVAVHELAAVFRISAFGLLSGFGPSGSGFFGGDPTPLQALLV